MSAMYFSYFQKSPSFAEQKTQSEKLGGENERVYLHVRIVASCAKVQRVLWRHMCCNASSQDGSIQYLSERSDQEIVYGCSSQLEKPELQTFNIST